MAWLLYRSVEVAGPVYAADRGPVLGVSTHFGGLPDPLLIVDSVSRWPRFMGKDVIFRTPGIGLLARYLGGIPVHQPRRSVDGQSDDSEDANRQMFASAHEALAEGNLVVIFPEGVTSENPAMAKVRTGAARIALGARSDGVSGIRILPIAIHYADRKSLRSRVFVNVGDPLVLDEWVAEAVPDGKATGSGNHAAVAKLTEDIERRMRAIAPDYSDWREAHLLQFAAEVALRDDAAYPGEPVGYAERETLAGSLNRRSSPEQKNAILTHAAEYNSALRALRLTDASLLLRAASARNFAALLALSVLAMILLLPFAVFGFAVNIIPMVLIWLVGRLPLSDPLMATVKPGVAILTFGLAWGVSLWSALENGVVYFVGTLVLLPLCLLALIVLSERFVTTVAAFALRRRARGTHRLLETVLNDRASLVSSVRAVQPEGLR